MSPQNSPQPDGSPVAELIEQIKRLAPGRERFDKCQQALASMPQHEASERWARLHFDMAMCLMSVSPDEQDPEQAIGHYEQALTVFTPAAYFKEWRSTLFNLALAHKKHPRERAAHLEKAIELCETILLEPALEQFSHEWALTHYELARLYTQRISGDPADNIETAIAHCQQALRGWTLAARPVHWAKVQDLLGTLYRRRLNQDPLENLNGSLEHHQAALKAIEPLRQKEADTWARIQHNLGTTWFHLHKLHGGGYPDDVEQAIAHYELALQVRTAARPAEHAETLRNLANAYLVRQKEDRAGNVEQALQYLRQVLEVRPRERYPVEWAKTHLALGNAYFRRLKGGRAENIEQALRYYLAAWREHKRASPIKEKAATLHDLAIAYSERLTGKRLINLKRAQAYGQKALRTVDRRDARLWGSIQTDAIDVLWKLGNLERQQGDQQSAAHLEQAIEYGKEVISSLKGPAFTHLLARVYYNLGNAYGDRIRGNRAENQALAIASYKQALELFDAQDMFWQAETHNNLGVTFLERNAQAEDVLQAISHLQNTLDLYPSLSFPVSVRRTARNLGNLYFAGRQWKEAINTYQRAIEASEQLYQASLMRVSKEVELAETAELYQRAAYALACQKDYTQAVTMLERGRARLLGEALERDRIDLEQLREGHAPLYDEYKQAAEQVQQWEQVELGARKAEEVEATRQAAHAKLDAAIQKIQHIQGYANFFSLPDFSEIQQVAARLAPAAIAYVGVFPAGGLALILQRGGVEPVWLDFAEADVDGLLVKRDGKRVTGGYLLAQLGGLPLEEALGQILPTLGEKVMQPVATALRGMGVSSVVLIPTGRLALFPLHAAQYGVNGSTRRFMDEFIVTYTPSAQALGHSRDTLVLLPKGEPSLFGVGNPLPLPEGARPLPFARPEVEEIAKLFDMPSTLLYEADATHPAVEKGLGTATYLHLSCHGQFNVQDPLSSGVILSQGEMITLRDLITRPMLKGTRLAVLSACQTAITDFNKLPEEAIGLPAGFLQAGVPGVVGSLWPVNELSTALLMIKFYEYHLRGDAETGEGPMPPAQALRQAQRWLRDVPAGELRQMVAAIQDQSVAYDETVSDAWRQFMAREPEEEPFAHPYYWAGFTFTGV